MYHALQYLEDCFTKSKNEIASSPGKHSPNLVVALNEEVVMETHRRLMQGPPGEIRSGTAYAGSLLFSRLYYYPKPCEIAIYLNTILDEYINMVEGLPTSLHDPDSLVLVFKLAAWFFYQVISLHPFTNENDRISRLLANHVLRLISPFPVAIHPSPGGTVIPSMLNTTLYRSEWSFRDECSKIIPRRVHKKLKDAKEYYCAAIEKARYSLSEEKAIIALEHQPADLAAMMIESAWKNWSILREQVEKHTLQQSCIF